MYTASRRIMRSVGRGTVRVVCAQTRALILEHGAQSKKNGGSKAAAGITSRNAVTVASMTMERESHTCTNAPRVMHPAWHMMSLPTITLVPGANNSSTALQTLG